jgi:hypothetical protein
MSFFDYEQSRHLSAEGFPFYSLIMSAYRQADTRNQAILALAYPNVIQELTDRYSAPGGILSTD